MEFTSPDIVREFLEKAKNHTFDMTGTTIGVKKAITKINAARNWALGEAQKRIAVLEAVTGAAVKVEVKIDWSERCVKHGVDVVFSQTPAELKGTFYGIAASLTLE